MTELTLINLFSQALTIGFRLALLVGLGAVGYIAIRLLARRFDRRLSAPGADEDRQARLATLVRLGRDVAIAIWLMLVGAMALHDLGFDIGPVLASAGVAGLALSLGAQALIKDYLAGLLILLEDHYRVGDVIRVGEVTGAVTRLTLRVTYLRDPDGLLHIIPNDELRRLGVANTTRNPKRITADSPTRLGRQAELIEQTQTH